MHTMKLVKNKIEYLPNYLNGYWVGKAIIIQLLANFRTKKESKTLLVKINPVGAY